MSPILFLAPFRSMAEIAKSIADQMAIPLIVEMADDAQAKHVLKRYSGIEVVISRGGVAEQIAEMENITLIEIVMSTNDLLSVLSRLTLTGIKRVGIVSRANIFDGTTGDFQISATQIFIRSCKNEEEIQRTVYELHKEEVEAIIGCRMAYETAKECGIMAEFLESSAVSIRKAIEEAVRVVKAKEKEKLQTAQLRTIIDNIEEGVIVVTGDKKVSFCNHQARKICDLDGDGPACHYIEELLQCRKQEKIVTINGTSIMARTIPLFFDNRNQGDVITFQEVSSIQASERKIRSAYQKGLYAKKTFDDMIVRSQVMESLIEKAKTYAKYDSNLLIYGETGTGKEVFAQSLHNHSKRRKGPFVSVNTASIPSSLLESELFGYVEGAFTGARKGGKQGLFELAHGGTIFLDEIGELSPAIQSRLLRVLQEKEIMRIGDDKIIPVDVRIISATNRHLYELVKEGSFRQDLYYRIHVLGLYIPPLRERREDIYPIFKYYVDKICTEERKHVEIASPAIKLLNSYDWPGNIRQLRNVAEVVAYGPWQIVESRDIAGILSEQETKVQSAKHITIPEAGTLKEMEMEILKHLLSRYSQEEVCRQLGISRVTLWRKAKPLFQN